LTPPAERTLQQHQKGWRSTLAIEDPFEPDFNPARNIVPDTWAVIRREMERAYHSLFEEPAAPFFDLWDSYLMFAKLKCFFYNYFFSSADKDPINIWGFLCVIFPFFCENLFGSNSNVV